MTKNLKYFIAAFITALFITASLVLAETTQNSYKNNSLTGVQDCDSCYCPCPDDDPTTFLDDTCSCTGDGSGGPGFPPDDKD